MSYFTYLDYTLAIHRTLSSLWESPTGSSGIFTRTMYHKTELVGLHRPSLSGLIYAVVQYPKC